jgi:ubiquitin-protein ligase
MTSIIQKKRFANELKLITNEPLHYITAYPDESNQFIWYFLLKGQHGTQYYGGEYIGKIVHSPKYPTEPPDYYMLTPNGRYEVDKKICLSNSSYHKGEWTSTWNIKTILIAFNSIFLDDTEYGISHIKRSPEERKQLAIKSLKYNLDNHNDIYQKFNHIILHDGTPKDNIKDSKIIIDDKISNINLLIEKQNLEIDELKKIL